MRLSRKRLFMSQSRTLLQKVVISRRAKRILIGLALVLFVTLAGVSYRLLSAKNKLVDVGGHRLYPSCTGEGSPTVILDAGMGGSSRSWSRIQPEIAKFTRVCGYDRANTGESDSVSKPRTIEQIVDDLNNLLTNAKVPAPYVLVGHSFGGMNVRMYAAKYPADAAGMVLVDSSLEDLFARWDAFVDAESMKRKRARMIDNPEGVDWEATCTKVRAANWRSDVPLIVLTQGREEDWSKIAPEEVETVKKMGQVFRELQADLMRHSSNSKQIIAERSGHNIHDDQPELVIDAIRQVVETVRQKGSLKADK